MSRAARVHQEAERSGDLDRRAVFQVDRDRVLYSSAFRRLAGVTQVVHVGEPHVFHNRMTHSLKVAQVGRALTRYLLNWPHTTELVSACGGADPDVVETACLCHDLGHPPFGHAGERELLDALEHRGVSSGFEGNAQSFRIVTRLSIRRAGTRGLNLTNASLNAILKYPWHRRTEGPHSHKWGYYDSEEQDFKAARSAVIATVAAGDPPRRTLEAEIMDWADDITYSVHDVEDFYKAGKVPLDRILSDRQGERSRFLAWASADSTGDAPLKPGADTEVGTAAWADRTFFDSMILTAGSTEILRPYDGSTAQCAALKLLTSFLIGRYLGCRGPKPMIRLIPDGPQRFLEIDEALACEVRLLQSMMRYYVFEAPALVAQQHGHRRVVRELFDMLSENETLLPERFRPKEGESQARCVADLIASLTENQALTLHKRLAGLEPGSIHDSVL